MYEPLTAAHADGLFPLLGDARVWAWIAGSDGATVGQMRASYALRARGSGRPGERWLNHAVRLRTGPLLGRIEATVHDEGWGEIAYVFGVAAWGQGYGREAVRWLLGEIGVPQVWATAVPDNIRSIRLLSALGFREAPATRPLPSWAPGDRVLRWDALPR